MDREIAIAFLKRHQPLPSDENLNKELLEKYDEVRRFFVSNPEPECIPLFLNSFGEGSGFGVYQRIEEVIAKFDIETVVPHLAKALSNPTGSVAYWCLQIASLFPSMSLFDVIKSYLRNPDMDRRTMAAIAMESIPDQKALDALEEALLSEKENDVRAMLEEIIQKRKSDA